MTALYYIGIYAVIGVIVAMLSMFFKQAEIRSEVSHLPNRGIDAVIVASFVVLAVIWPVAVAMAVVAAITAIKETIRSEHDNRNEGR